MVANIQTIDLQGEENLPLQGQGAILICNHALDIDPRIFIEALLIKVGFLGAPFMGKVPAFCTLLQWSRSVAIGTKWPEPWQQQVHSLLTSWKVLVVFPKGQQWLLAQNFKAPSFIQTLQPLYMMPRFPLCPWL